jgi:hypothetical protein
MIDPDLMDQHVKVVQLAKRLKPQATILNTGIRLARADPHNRRPSARLLGSQS